MAFPDTISKAYWAVGNIGVTPDIRPEEAKHIRYFNIGTFLIITINLGYFLKDLPDEEAPVRAIAQISTAVLCLLVYVFHIQGRYNTARIYGFLLFYAENLITSQDPGGFLTS